MADDQTTFKIDLDASDFLKAIEESKSGILGLAKADNLKGLIEGFDSLLPVIGGVTAAILAIKAAMGTVFEAEEIKAINEQFEILAANAGLSGENIKKGMEVAAGGLVDTTDLLKLSNEAIIKLGSSAARLPELMELARKSSVVTGKDLQTTFEMMTQAIETGNKRMLTRVGLNVDVNKAEREYAESLGISVDALSEAEKRQAIMNAALADGQTKLAGIDPNIKEATNTWQQFKVTIHELSETFTLWFDGVFGPKIREMLKLTAQLAVNVRNWFQNSGKDVDYYREKLIAAREEQEKLSKGPGATPGAAPGEAGGPSDADYQKRAEQESKFQKELTALKVQGAKEREQIVMSEADVDAAMNQRKLLLETEYQTQLQLIKTNHQLSESQRLMAIRQLNQNHEAKITANALQAENERQSLLEKSLDNQAKATDKFYTKFAAGAHKASLQARKEFMDFSKLGQESVNKLANATSSAFAQMGEGTADLATAMKRAILGALADEAQSRGALLIASSIFPPNPLGLAAGAGLSVLAGVLRGLAGGGSSTITTPTTAAGGGVVGAEAPVAAVSSTGTDTSTAAQAAPRQHFTLQVQGSYFETEQTRDRLVEILRQAGDNTDFKIQAIGGGL